MILLNVIAAFLSILVQLHLVNADGTYTDCKGQDELVHKIRSNLEGRNDWNIFYLLSSRKKALESSNQNRLQCLQELYLSYLNEKTYETINEGSRLNCFKQELLGAQVDLVTAAFKSETCPAHTSTPVRESCCFVENNIYGLNYFQRSIESQNRRWKASDDVSCFGDSDEVIRSTHDDILDTLSEAQPNVQPNYIGGDPRTTPIKSAAISSESECQDTDLAKLWSSNDNDVADFFDANQKIRSTQVDLQNGLGNATTNKELEKCKEIAASNDLAIIFRATNGGIPYSLRTADSQVIAESAIRHLSDLTNHSIQTPLGFKLIGVLLGKLAQGCMQSNTHLYTALNNNFNDWKTSTPSKELIYLPLYESIKRYTEMKKKGDQISLNATDCYHFNLRTNLINLNK